MHGPHLGRVVGTLARDACHGYTLNVSSMVEQLELSSVFLVLYMRGEQGSELRKVSSKSHVITFR
jgi:hypothetical protein